MEGIRKRNKKFMKAIAETKPAVVAVLDNATSPMANSVLYNNISSSSSVINAAIKELEKEGEVYKISTDKYDLWLRKGRPYAKNWQFLLRR